MSGYDPDSETDGKYIVAFAESAGNVSPIFERKVREIMEKHIPHIREDEWYRAGDVATAYQKIIDEVGESTMLEGGKEGAKLIEWPDEVTTVEDALNALIPMHRQAYRNSTQTNPGSNYSVKRIDGRTADVGVLEGWPFGAGYAKGVFKQIAQDFGGSDVAPTFEEREPEPDEKHAWTMEW